MTDAQIDAVAGLIFKFRICGSNRDEYPCEFCEWSADPVNPDPFAVGCRWLAREILQAVETAGEKWGFPHEISSDERCANPRNSGFPIHAGNVAMTEEQAIEACAKAIRGSDGEHRRSVGA